MHFFKHIIPKMFLCFCSISMIPSLALATDAKLANPLEAIRLEDLSATRERPLLSPGRHPPPKPASNEAALVNLPLEPAPFFLIGTAVAWAQSIAILRDRAGGKTFIAKTGEEFEGWQIVSINAASLVARFGSRVDIVALRNPTVDALSPQEGDRQKLENLNGDLADHSRKTAQKAIERTDLKIPTVAEPEMPSHPSFQSLR